MTWLARIFEDIGDFFYWTLWDIFRDIAWEFYDAWDIFAPIGDLFLDIAGICDDIGEEFFDIAAEIDSWWDEICDLWDDLNDLYDYAHYWLRNKVYDALDWAEDAWNKAVAAYNLAVNALTEIPVWVLAKLADAYDAALAIAGVIGTTVSQIIQFIRDYAVITYQTIVENIYNTFQTFNEIINNIYQTLQYISNTFITNIIGVTVDIVRDLINAALAPFDAPIKLIELWFNDIQNFFNDPLGWLWDKMINHLEKYW